jgi:hypothetical protein
MYACITINDIHMGEVPRGPEIRETLGKPLIVEGQENVIAIGLAEIARNTAEIMFKVDDLLAKGTLTEEALALIQLELEKRFYSETCDFLGIPSDARSIGVRQLDSSEDEDDSPSGEEPEQTPTKDES